MDILSIAAGDNNIGNVDIVTIPNITLNTLTPVDFLDSGLVDAASTAITTAGLQIVASLSANVKEIEIIEDIGEFMVLTDGSDVYKSYLPLGGGRVIISLTAGTALKLRSLTGASITSGKIAMNLLG
jgi:hypothetical protein